MSGPAGLLNPNDPYQFIHPHDATYVESLAFVSFITLGAWSWDALMTLSGDTKMISLCFKTKKRLTLSLIIYHAARLSTLLCILASVILQAFPVDHCQAWTYVAGVAMSMALSCSAFLFLLRIKAVFEGSYFIVIPFSLLWFAIPVTSTLSIPATHAETIGPTKRCWITGEEMFGTILIPLSLTTLFDTLIFLLISYRLANLVAVDLGKQVSWMTRLRTTISGKYLPKFLRSLLRGGQKYYFITACVNIIVLVLMFGPSSERSLRDIFVLPSICLQNTLACRVYRQTFLDWASTQKFLTSAAETESSSNMEGAQAGPVMALASGEGGGDPMVLSTVNEV